MRRTSGRHWWAVLGISVAVATSLPSVAFAGAGVWTSGGLYRGDTEAPAIAGTAGSTDAHCRKLRALLETNATGDIRRTAMLRDAFARLECAPSPEAPRGVGGGPAVPRPARDAASAGEDVLQRPTGRLRDYIFPGEAPRSDRVVPALGPQGEAARDAGEATAPCIDCAEAVTYTAFDGAVYQLQAFKGKNVALLLPDSWLGAGGLSAEERRSFLDRSDWFYEHYKELMQGEPGGTGLLTIAAVPVTCGWGCGYVGWKGIEFDDYQFSLDYVRQEIAADKASTLIIHEMTHNFDLHSSYLYYLPDHAHAWTDFMDAYSAVYARSGKKDLSPEGLQADEIQKRYRPYYQDPTADWAECVRDGLCEGRGIYRNYSWGGVTQRFAQLHGPEAVRTAVAFLNAYEGAHPAPSGAEAREDLHVEAMAAGAGLDLGCYVDAWRWQASPALRARMTATYGAANAFCADADTDGFSVLAGDCDDGSAAAHPGATETANGADDDCNGLVDDLLVAEPFPGDFPNPRSIGFPSQVRGRITTGDGDFFLFTLPSTPSTHAVEINLCSDPDFQGWLFVYDQGGAWLDYHHVSQGQCSSKTYNLTGGLTWKIGVELNVNSLLGAYRMTVATRRPWPATWGSAEPIACASGYRLRSTTQSLSGALAAPGQVRFWVSGVGFVGSTAYTSPASYIWLPAGIQETTQGYRAQLVSGPTPVEDATAARWFSATDCPVVRLSDVSVTEGNTGTKVATFAATLSSASSQTVTVGFGTADGTATTADGDYVAASGTLIFSPGVSASSLTVTVNGDTKYEANETFFLDLSNATNAPISDASGVGTITNDDTPPALSIGDVTLTEGNSTTTASFTVSLAQASGQTVSVNYATADGTATVAGGDYVSTFGSVTIPAGSLSQGVAIGVNGDRAYELDETFFLNLSSPTNATLADAQGVGTITNDDPPPTLSIGDVTVPRGPSGTTSAVFPVTLSAASYQSVTVAYATADGTATGGVDYVGTTGGLSFAPGVTTANVNVTVNGSLGPEGKKFFVDLGSPVNAGVADGRGQATLVAIGQGFYTVTPCRALDTRNPAPGTPLAAGVPRTFALTGTCGIPLTARAVSLNITVTEATSSGNVRLYPGGTATPTVSTVNFTAALTRANNAITPLGTNGDVSALLMPAGTVHVIVDVNGYFE